MDTALLTSQQHQQDDEGIWDELSHQQTREIEQHHFRMAAQRHQQHHHQRSQPHHPLVEAGTTTWKAFVAAGTSAAGAAQQAWREHQQQQYDRHQSTSAPNDDDWQEFGLGRSSSNASRSQQQQQQQQQQAFNGGGQQHREPLLFNENGGGNSNMSHQQHQQQQQQQNPADGNFVFLKNVQWRPQREGWGAVPNLDLFFSSLYQYYYHRGFWPMVGKSLVEVVTLFFTLGLSIFLFAKVDWQRLRTCTDESSCRDQFGEYLIPNIFRHHSALWSFWIVLYGILFLWYGVFCLWSLFHTLQDAWQAKYVFEEKLGIAAHTLEGGAVDWERHVVDKLLQLQASGQYRIVIHDGPEQALDALAVAQRILRKENFLIAFFNQGHPDNLLLPLNPLIVSDSQRNKPLFLQHQKFFCKSLEWSLYFCVLNFMFNHKYQIRPAFYLDPVSLKRRFRLCGICHAVFLPFLLLFMTLHFALQNVYDWKSTKQYFGPREWSSAAKWTLREFNELPHVFERRLGPSYEAAESYLKLFRQDELITSVGRILAFIGGSLGVVLLAMATLNDAILLHVKIGNYNLLWFVGVSAVIYSVGKALIPNPTDHQPYFYNTRNLHDEMSTALGKVAAHTHYFPDSWKRRAWDKTTTYKAFCAMFQYKALLFAMEILSVIVAPYLLCVSLPQCAERICEFVLATRTEVPGVGDVCGFGTFDFDKFGDENWEGRTMGPGSGGQQQQQNRRSNSSVMMTLTTTGSLSASILQIGNVEQAKSLHPTPKARQGKMEKSFFNFKAAHPNWRCSKSGQSLVDRVNKYQQDETAALSRERQLYIEVAAHQLEILAQLEQLRPPQHQFNAGLSPTLDHDVMDESYLSPGVANTAGADTGGGGVIRNSAVMDSSAADLLHARPPNGGASSLTSPSRVTFVNDDAAVSSTPDSKETTMEDTQPPFAQPPLSPPNFRQSSSTLTPTMLSETRLSSLPAVNSGALSIGLSTELRRILNMSTLDPDVSVAGSVLGGTYDPSTMSRSTLGAMNAALASLVTEEGQREGIAERQYLWLERYHAHLAQQRQQRPDANDESPSDTDPQSDSEYLHHSNSIV